MNGSANYVVPPVQVQVQSAPQNPADDSSQKSWLATFLLCFFFGVIGIHRFYVGRTGSAIAMILTLGGLGLWTIVDFIVILFGNFKDGDGKKIKVK